MFNAALANPEIKAISTHTQKPTAYEGTLPLVFVRHPLERVLSAYLFERQLKLQTYAKTVDLETYIKHHLTTGIFSNYQSQYIDNYKRELPFIGVVDKFEESMVVYRKLIRKQGIELTLVPMHENACIKEYKSCHAILYLKSRIPHSLWHKLHDVNKLDIMLYNYCFPLIK